MIDTGHTLELAARTLKDKGAKTIHALISHGECLPLVGATHLKWMMVQVYLRKRTCKAYKIFH